ncbi:MAG: transcriptional regulator, partial [Comamonadaceae bacterium]|nr:transcriptional regulator [Comamonadaceae bacterium]
LQADAADHMARVAAQGDMRPMAASPEAMEDLKRILAGRSAFYAKADLRFDTSHYADEDAAFTALQSLVRTSVFA